MFASADTWLSTLIRCIDETTYPVMIRPIVEVHGGARRHAEFWRISARCSINDPSALVLVVEVSSLSPLSPVLFTCRASEAASLTSGFYHEHAYPVCISYTCAIWSESSHIFRCLSLSTRPTLMLQILKVSISWPWKHIFVVLEGASLAKLRFLLLFSPVFLCSCSYVA